MPSKQKAHPKRKAQASSKRATTIRVAARVEEQQMLPSVLILAFTVLCLVFAAEAFWQYG